jgi:AraC-like DNA-binding protein
MHREYAAARLAALSDTPDFSAQLRRWLVTNLATGVPERSTAAEQFALSDRVFARRLQSQGLSYSEVVDGVRKDAACTAVAATDATFIDIAQNLGFSEASAFNRAFKRWTGSSPGEWRGVQKNR